MEKAHTQSRWWDWSAVGLLFVLLQVFASRLVTTSWTPYLYFILTFTSMGFAIGAATGYSIFQQRTARWLSFGYMLFMLPLIWIFVIDQQVTLDEQLLSVGGRLLYSISEFFSRRPVDDPLFFVAVMSVVFWVISASAAFHLIRGQNFLLIVLPATIGMLVIQHYDNGITGRVWILGTFIFIALFLLGRLNFLQDQKIWRERRVFLSPENSIDLTSSMAIAAGLIIIIAWTFPLSITRIDSVRQVWQHITKPWTNFIDRMENAVSALKSPNNSSPGEFYGTELQLGLGFPLSDAMMFEVTPPETSPSEKPPRYYWRGRVYDYFSNGQWHTMGASREEFSPLSPDMVIANTERGKKYRFLFKTSGTKFSLLYAPSEPVWFSRPGSFLTSPADSAKDIFSWEASPSLLPGETYQVDAVLSNPDQTELRRANTQYPEWVTKKYLQLPDNFSPRIIALAQQITAQANTPYDKAVAITNYLRDNIEYTPTITQAPRNVNLLEWFLFDYKKGFCVYYATSEVLMLRSLGIPARMAVGFAEGSSAGTTQGLSRGAENSTLGTYSVLKKNAHAWPEVYFTGIGWVEFEPTANQAPLDRPAVPQQNTPPSNLSNSGKKANLESDLADQPDTTPKTIPDPNASRNATLLALLYLLPLFIALAALTIYLSRRYSLPARVPIFVRATIERTGIAVPNWVIHWERWGSLSSIERSFESINFGLRQVKQPAPVHATPSERANTLAEILPQIESQLKVLLDEHQTSLYTSRVADERQARQAAFQVRTQVIISLIRHFFIGKYEKM